MSLEHADPGATSAPTGHHGMVPYLHFIGGDALFFEGLKPTSASAIAGACIVLFAIALFERWVSGKRSAIESRWRQKALALVSEMDPKKDDTTTPRTSEGEKSDAVVEGPVVEEVLPSTPPSRTQNVHPRRTYAPFILAQDAPRGAIYAFQALLGYTLMLSVMTFQAAYFIAIIAGLGIGEVFFGRMRVAGSSVDH